MLGRIAIDLSQDSTHDLRLNSGISLAREHEAELVGVYTNSLLAQYLYSDDTLSLCPRKPEKR